MAILDVLEILPFFAPFLIGGFFSSILKIAAPIISAFVSPGIPLQAAAVTQATIEGGVPVVPTAAAAAAAGALRQQTIVQTLDPAGKVVKQRVTPGGVAVFQQDVTAANRVARQLRRLDKRLPRKLIKQSEAARLRDEVTEAALRRARDGLDCPPKC